MVEAASVEDGWQYAAAYFVCEAFAWSALATGVGSGMSTLKKHEATFSEFQMSHVWKLRIDAFFYLLVSFSTSLCLIDMFLRASWMYLVGWRDLPLVWRVLYLVVVHGGFGWFSSFVHVGVGKLLERADFCALCQRRL